jgi:hypothetical protein
LFILEGSTCTGGQDSTLMAHGDDEWSNLSSISKFYEIMMEDSWGKKAAAR